MYRLGIIGYPVKHSKSPLIHNAWLKENNFEGSYELIPVENQEELPAVFQQLKTEGFTGVNITVPYKNAMFEITQSAGYTISHDAETLKAVNTINFLKEEAFNTDSFGFSKLYQPKPDDLILIIGAGGVASSVVLSCQGANITITNRTMEKAEAIAEEFMCDLFRGDLTKLDLSGFDVIINATSLGLNSEELPLNYKTLQKHTKCIDTIYNPKLTPFLQVAQKKGCKVENGTMMLINQGAKSFYYWTGKVPNIQTAKGLMKEFVI
ncbi:MAG: shikimate dehydrogenase [Proteobacteria bacterium]|jgi:shikimate dehydrogenase|nr:shikimate dehydrogenase [Pseudomonadota bacterium]